MDKKIFYKKIKKCLNNENGGPNLEQIMGIGTTLGLVAGFQALKKTCEGLTIDMATAANDL